MAAGPNDELCRKCDTVHLIGYTDPGQVRTLVNRLAQLRHRFDDR